MGRLSRKSKQKKIDKLKGNLHFSHTQNAGFVPEDLRDLNDIAPDIDIPALLSYMNVQRDKADQLEAQSEADTGADNPFSKLITSQILSLTENRNEYIAQGARLELGRRDFYYFCRLKNPNFYKPGRDFLVTLCHEMQSFYESDDVVMVINLPPRHGKSYTAGMFEQWVFGKNKTEKIMTGSYNETLSTTFSKTVRNGISEEKADPYKIVYSDIFPGIRIQRGDGAMNLWALEGQHASYLATSPGGTATGFGATIIVMDDLIKSSTEAFNEDLLQGHWSWFTDTMLSRLENGGKIIIIMTRWASGDLAGRAIEHFQSEGTRYRVLSMKAVTDEKSHTMLCEEILSYRDYRMKARLMSEEVASANYQQQPIDMQGRLYQQFKTYDDIPRNSKGKPLFTAIRAYCDTADTGSDYLCNIIYGEYLKEAYILDVYYTKDAMEKTEPETAKRLYDYGVRIADIESNNGGRGFARSVERILKGKYRTNRCKVKWFHQSQNKRARILTNSVWVQDHVYFPRDWKNRWPDYYKAMFKYQKEGKNAHDDAPDATTGIAEKMGNGGGVNFLT